MPDPDDNDTQKAVALWIDANREVLPLNIDTWKINIVTPEKQEDLSICQGKYSASVYRTDSFYKSICRMITIKL